LSTEKPARRIQDIVDNAEAVFRYTDGMEFEAFRDDSKSRDAVERCLERVSEAASKLGDLAALLVPDQPWAQIRALGNQLRHQYDTLEVDEIWRIATVDLPRLENACRAALARIVSGIQPL
jgi:uncharacterized protein with HEPN domain